MNPPIIKLKEMRELSDHTDSRLEPHAYPMQALKILCHNADQPTNQNLTTVQKDSKIAWHFHQSFFFFQIM